MNFILRNYDLVIPLIHKFQYQTLIYDLFEI